MIKRPVWANLFIVCYLRKGRRLSLTSTSAMWRRESGVCYSAISASPPCKWNRWSRSVSSRSDPPAPQQLQHGVNPMTDFIANCGEPEYEEVVVIKMFNGMLGALDLDCFFPPSSSCALSPPMWEVVITATTKKRHFTNVYFNEWFGVGAGHGLVFFVVIGKQMKKKKEIYLKTAWNHGCAVMAHFN